jgi:hypothetical protein
MTGDTIFTSNGRGLEVLFPGRIWKDVTTSAPFPYIGVRNLVEAAP